MKKVLLIAAVAVFGLSNVYAQGIHLGVKAGANFASIGGDDTDDFSGRTSFHLGVVAEFGISEKFSIQPELLYNSVGATSEFTEDFDGFDVKIDETVKLDYLSVPIFVKYKITNNFSVEAGPQISFLLSAKDEFEASFDGETESDEEDIKDFVSSVDFGLGLGATYELNNGLFFSARYVFGLSDINDFEDSGDISIQNNVFQLSVGYFFL